MLLLPGACSKHCGAKSDVEEWDGGMGAPIESHHGATEAWVLPEVLRCFEFRQVLRCFLKNLRKGDQKGETNCGGGFDKTLDGLTSETQHSASCLHLLFLPWCLQCFINHLNQWTSLLESGKHAAFFIAPIRQGIPPPKSPRSFPGHHQDVISTGSASWLIVVGFSIEPPKLHGHQPLLSNRAGRHRSVAFGVLLFVLLTDPWTKVWFGLPC